MRGKELKVLMLGGSGFVATGVQVALENSQIEFITPSHKDVNILDKKSLEGCVNENKPDTIWNFVAYTNVNGAQKNPELAKAANLDGAINVAEVALESKIPLIHSSTDFGFKGTEDYPGPYRVDSKTANVDSKEIGEYARYKLMAEHEVLNIHPNAAVVRISYPIWSLNYKKDYLAKIKYLILNGISIADDQYITITHVPKLGRNLEKMVRESMGGIYHVATSPVTTPYKIACYLAPRLGLNCEIIQGSIYDFLKLEGQSPIPIHGGLISSFRPVNVWKAIDQVVGQRSF